jgi:hypothetical protein
MKTKPEMDPAAAFPDAKHQPDEAELNAALGPAAGAVEKIIESLPSLHPEIATAWQFSERSGWYLLLLLKKRRLLYLIPKRGDFRAMLILGGKAIALLKAGPFARRTATQLKTAKKYPEGTAFSFDRKSLEPDLIAAFLAAKIAH